MSVNVLLFRQFRTVSPLLIVFPEARYSLFLPKIEDSEVRTEQFHHKVDKCAELSRK